MPTTERAPLKKPVEPEESSPDRALVEIFDRLERDLTADSEAQHADCTRFALAVSQWLGRHADDVRQLSTESLGLAKARQEDLDAEVSARATTVVFVAAECGHSEIALAAYDEFDALAL